LTAPSATGRPSPSHEKKSEHWWQVDLGGAFDISAITIFNRPTSGGRLRGAVVEALDSTGSVLWTGMITGAVDGSVHELTVVVPPPPATVPPPQNLIVAKTGSRSIGFAGTAAVADSSNGQSQPMSPTAQPAAVSPITAKAAAVLPTDTSEIEKSLFANEEESTERVLHDVEVSSDLSDLDNSFSKATDWLRAI
jgi:hypothetical protein